MNAKHRFNTKSKGLWECCNNTWYTANGKCRICGKGSDNRTKRSVANSKPERILEDALDEAKKTSQIILKDNERLVITIKRSGSLDGDNMVGGCKPLRDSICSALGLKDDKESDKLRFKYEKIKRKFNVVVIGVEKIGGDEKCKYHLLIWILRIIC